MSSRRRSILVALLVTILIALMSPVIPARAADGNPDLSVSIRSLSPSRLAEGSTVTMSGTVTNNDKHAWTNVQAYLVIPIVPFTTRAQIVDAIDNNAAYTGTRVTDTEAFDTLGDLAAGESKRFTVTVPYDRLGISGAEGVYPVGVQILGTDVTGERSPDAIARATTFLPLISSKQGAVPASVVWPFLMPDRRKADGDYSDPAALLAAVSTGGQLRNVLNLASSIVGGASTALVDPALLVGVDDLANGRHLPASFDITDGQKVEAERFLQDLLAYTRRESSWVLGFDRPDDLALSQNKDISKPLTEAINTATSSALTTYQITGRRVSWPTRSGVTATLLRDLRGAGDSPVIVSPASLPGWQRRQGSLVQYVTDDGPVPLLVNDILDADVPGETSVVTVRQRILSEAALAVLQRAIDSRSRADAVTMVDPSWNPGTQFSSGKLSEAFTAPFTKASTLEGLLTTRPSTYTGAVPTTAGAKPLNRAVLLEATRILSRGRALSSVTPQRDSVDQPLAREVASVLGVRWRSDQGTAIKIARTRARRAGSELSKIQIKGPPSVTLSSAKGGFPLTITNGTNEAIRIGISLDSSNPALRIPHVKPVDIDAGERRTLTVQVDLGRQNTTTLSAHLSSTDGRQIGRPAVFNVRSSKVGAVLWVAMGLAALLVLGALFRRFRRYRNRATAVTLPDDDD
ncbi:DUF6049 family protein [Aeromicrobium sp.]|uniref:DUF6049 family protein n=1 Tax=Aeromicrobium sp. TaxID=1871063 RepID=UPI0019CF052E|nr:DUF6049 family protein [Aeromicrobium sp.]MBC7633010.1 hypothetical protein [Aeromicrobium sp.]